MRIGRNALTIKDRKRVIDLYKSGLSRADIAKRFSCSVQPIRGIINDYQRNLDYENGKDIEERKKKKEAENMQNL